MSARSVSPVYDGERVEVVGEWAGDCLQIEAQNERGEVCATGVAAMTARRRRSPSRTSRTSRCPSPTRGHPRARRSSARSRSACYERRWHAAHALEYLEIVSDDLEVYRDPPIAHPGWIFRGANYVLSQSVRLGPWIHVESECRHHSVVTDGETVSTAVGSSSCSNGDGTGSSPWTCSPRLASVRSHRCGTPRSTSPAKSATTPDVVTGTVLWNSGVDG